MVGYAREPVDQPGFERWSAPVREALSDEEFAAAWTEGQAMTLDDAVDEASAIAHERNATAPRVRVSDPRAMPRRADAPPPSTVVTVLSAATEAASR
jgi:xanthine/CO dehydrogenase XdhC/CoxF family maturation factor